MNSVLLCDASFDIQCPHKDIIHIQVLFSDWTEPWRESRRHADSELHLVPKIKMQVVFSNSIKKDYKLLPK